jgi:hypothetical protein
MPTAMSLSVLCSILALALGVDAGAKPPALAPPSARLDLGVVVDRVQKRYDGASDFRARFNQTLTSTAFKRRTPSTG